MEINQKGYIPPSDNRAMPNLMELGHVTSVAEQFHAVNVEGYRNGKEYSLVKVAGMAYWLPQIGDMVVLAFIDGKNEMPIILNKIMGIGNNLFASKKDDIHVDHLIKDSDGKPTGRIELHTDKNGNLQLNLGGLKGNLAINANGTEGNIYLHGKGVLKINVVGDAGIKSSGNIKMEAMGDAEIDCDGDINAVCRGGANITSEGDTAIASTGKTTVQAEGDVEVDGENVLLGKNMSKHPANNFPTCLFTGAPHTAPENTENNVQI